MKKKMKILILIHPELNPFKLGLVESKKTDSPSKCESFVYSALKKLGHEAVFLELDQNLDSLVEYVNQNKVDLVFNLLEELSGEAKFDFHAISYLESRGIPFTGNGPRALMLTRDKMLSKLVVDSLGFKTPRSHLIRSLKEVDRFQFLFPIFLKINSEDASLGISQANRVNSKSDLKKLFKKLRTLTTQPLLAEEFVAGSDVSIGIIGRKKPIILPARELRFPNENWVAGEGVKFLSKVREKNKIKSMKLKWKSKQERESCEEMALEIYKALGMRGYGRIDFRMTKDRQFFFLEANANPDLSKDEDFGLSAKSYGFRYEELLSKVIKCVSEAQ